MYDVAITIAKNEQVGSDDLADIFRQYGNHYRQHGKIPVSCSPPPIYSTDLRGSSHYNLTNLYRMSKIDGMYLNTELSSLSALAVG